MEFLSNLWDLFVDMSFYIVIGLLFTGILHAFVDKDTVLKQVGKKNTASVVKASVVGVPLPLCSCGVVPTALYLGKSGASKGAVVSFLTSTPQTGVDSIIATYGLMGPLFAVYRAVAAFISGIFAGIMTNIFSGKDDIDYSTAKTSCGCGGEETQSSCCGHTEEVVTSCSCEHAEDITTSCGCSHEVSNTSCCGNSGVGDTTEKTPFLKKLATVFTYAFGEFLDEIALHFVIGLLVAALISTLIPEAWLATFTNPLMSMILMLVIGIPMYICSTASIPIALSLMIKGVSPGAAFVFLFAGPVTNIASLTILLKSLGKKVLAIYLASVAFCAIVFGLIFDYIIELFNYTGITKIIEDAHAHEMPLYMTVVAVVFAVLIIRSLAKQFFSRNREKASCACSH